MEHDVRQRLLHRAFLYDDPTAFLAGVEAAIRELAPLLPLSDAPVTETAQAVSVDGPVRAAG